MHPRRHVDRVQHSFHIPTLPPPFLPAGASVGINFSVWCIIFCLFFCFRLLLFCPAPFHLSTEDDFSHMLEPPWRAIPLPRPRSAPHHPVFVRMSHPFTIFSSLFVKALPQEKRLVPTHRPRTWSFLCLHWGRRDVCVLLLKDLLQALKQ